MITKEQVESLLKINGVSTNANTESIRSVLLSANYHKEEIDTALVVLRQDSEGKKKVEGLHRVFRTSDTLSPEEINKLLGIEVDASRFVDMTEQKSNYSNLSTIVMLCMVLVFIVVGIGLYIYLTIQQANLLSAN